MSRQVRSPSPDKAIPMRNLCSRDRFDWRPGERINGVARSRAQAEADLQSARQALRAGREWLSLPQPHALGRLRLPLRVQKINP
jgi:hypothetical protein